MSSSTAKAMTQSSRRDMSAILRIVNQKRGGKFHLQVERISDRTGIFYHFMLTREKALKLANANFEFPLGAKLNLSGRVSKNDLHSLNHVQITAVDGHDVQSWAELNGSPAVNPAVLVKAQERILEEGEEAMKFRAPPEPPPVFASSEEAYEKAMYVVRRQTRLKDPKLSQPEIWIVRDALNFFKADIEKYLEKIGILTLAAKKSKQKEQKEQSMEFVPF